MEVLDNIAVSLDTETVIDRLHLGEKGTSFKILFDELLEEVLPIAKPKILFKVSFLDERNENSVSIDGVEFHSRILRKNLEKVERVLNVVREPISLDTSVENDEQMTLLDVIADDDANSLQDTAMMRDAEENGSRHAEATGGAGAAHAERHRRIQEAHSRGVGEPFQADAGENPTNREKGTL